MKTRVLQFAVLAICLAAALITVPVIAADDFVEGKHYLRLNPPQPTSTGDKIEVVEMFWYGCEHCNRLEPYVNRWLKKKPDNVEFVRIPGIFSPGWMLHARTYYTAEVLGVEDQVHEAMFETIHGKKQRLDSPDAIMAVFKEHGVSEDDFKKTFSSYAVETKVRRALEMTMRYDIDGVPALIINGKYRTSVPMAGSNPGAFRVVDYLIGQESK